MTHWHRLVSCISLAASGAFGCASSLADSPSTPAVSVSSPAWLIAGESVDGTPVECPQGVGGLSREEPTVKELRSAAEKFIGCWVAALNARHAPSLARVYDANSVQLFGDSSSTERVIEAQLSQLMLTGEAYVVAGLDVRVDQFRQLSAVIRLRSSSGVERSLLARFSRIERQVRLYLLADQREEELGERCAGAVYAALYTIPSVNQWQRSLSKDLHPGGISSPLRDGVFETTLGASFPDRMEVVFSATVTAGHLEVSEMGLWELSVPANAEERVRKACVEFEDDCRAACDALGQCVRKGKTCVATRDEQCEQSEVCAKFGHCHAGGRYGQCVAKSDAECKLVDCAGIGSPGMCSLVGDTCLVRKPSQKELDEMGE